MGVNAPDRMPPRMMTTMKRAGAAFASETANVHSDVRCAIPPHPCRRDRITTTMIKPMALMIAGMTPAANRPAIDILATTPMMMRSMVGGTRVAVAPAAASRAVLKGSG